MITDYTLSSPCKPLKSKKKTHSAMTTPFLPAKNVLEVGFEPTRD